MHKPSKLILIDDSESEARLMEYALASLANPPDFLHFEDPKLFFAYLENNDPEDIALLLLDLNMPSMNGCDVLDVLRKQLSLYTLPVVVMSSSRATEDIHACYAHGANAFVVKPMNISDLSVIVARVVDFWVECNLHAGGYTLARS